MRIGQAATNALIDGDDGRYMRALKSILGHDLLHESRLLGGKRQTLADIVTAFLKEIKARAEVATGHSFRRVLSGRPVQFHSDHPDRDEKAEADLRECYHAAGLTCSPHTVAGMGGGFGLRARCHHVLGAEDKVRTQAHIGHGRHEVTSCQHVDCLSVSIGVDASHLCLNQ